MLTLKIGINLLKNLKKTDCSVQPIKILILLLSSLCIMSLRSYTLGSSDQFNPFGNYRFMSRLFPRLGDFSQEASLHPGFSVFRVRTFPIISFLWKNMKLVTLNEIIFAKCFVLELLTIFYLVCNFFYISPSMK